MPSERRVGELRVRKVAARSRCHRRPFTRVPEGRRHRCPHRPNHPGQAYRLQSRHIIVNLRIFDATWDLSQLSVYESSLNRG